MTAAHVLYLDNRCVGFPFCCYGNHNRPVIMFSTSLTGSFLTLTLNFISQILEFYWINGASASRPRTLLRLSGNAANLFTLISFTLNPGVI